MADAPAPARGGFGSRGDRGGDRGRGRGRGRGRRGGKTEVRNTQFLRIQLAEIDSWCRRRNGSPSPSSAVS